MYRCTFLITENLRITEEQKILKSGNNIFSFEPHCVFEEKIKEASI